MKRIVLGAAAIGGAVVAYREVVRPWWRSWGIDEQDVARALPGDGLVPAASAADTRSIEIQAPPSVVWPWLVQMGYGRAGWYSYDQIDMAGTSVRRIKPEWQGSFQRGCGPDAPGRRLRGSDARARTGSRPLLRLGPRHATGRRRTDRQRRSSGRQRPSHWRIPGRGPADGLCGELGVRARADDRRNNSPHRAFPGWLRRER